MLLFLQRRQGSNSFTSFRDTRSNAHAHGGQWIPIKPGTDLALILAIADVVFQQKLYDQSFIDKWIEPTGFAQWKNYVTGVTDGVEKTPQWAESITGIPSETITALAQLYAQSKPSRLMVGWEACRSFSTNVSRAAILLQAMMGYLFMPGGGGPFEMGYSKNPWMAGPSPSPATTGAIFIPTKWSTPTAFNLTKWQKAILLREQYRQWNIISRRLQRSYRDVD